jgi:hopene-associated glycosyltransferase HpnB
LATKRSWRVGGNVGFRKACTQPTNSLNRAVLPPLLGNISIYLLQIYMTIISLLTWLILIIFWGKFWQTQPQIETEIPNLDNNTNPLPSVCAVIPARNEAALLPKTLRSLLSQTYTGDFNIILVDDQSTDNTAIIAKEIAEELGKENNLHVITGSPLPANWTGKLWAMYQGVEKANSRNLKPDYILLTDADIDHDKDNLWRLVRKAEKDNLALVSVMVKLRCENFWEKLLIPAFVFFFFKLYPPSWVNNPHSQIAAAAGGCILVKGRVLEEIGGIEIIKDALIDDCALAAAIKLGVGEKQGLSVSDADFDDSRKGARAQRREKFSIWLGMSCLTKSDRPYDNLDDIWNMVARTAFTQLKYSPLLLVGSLLGLMVIYVVPPLGFITGLVSGNWLMAITGLMAWLLMSFAYLPMIRFYQCSLLYTFCLPIIALFYNFMTLDSAWRHWRGRGGAWKGRVY